MNKGHMSLIRGLVRRAYVLFPIDSERYELAVQIGRLMDGPACASQDAGSTPVQTAFELVDERTLAYLALCVYQIGRHVGDRRMQDECVNFVRWGTGENSFYIYDSEYADILHVEDLQWLLDEVRMRCWEGHVDTHYCPERIGGNP